MKLVVPCLLALVFSPLCFAQSNSKTKAKVATKGSKAIEGIGKYDKIMICYFSAKKAIYQKQIKDIKLHPVISTEVDGIIFGDYLSLSYQEKLVKIKLNEIADSKKDFSKKDRQKLFEALKASLKKQQESVIKKHMQTLNFFAMPWIAKCGKAIDRVFFDYCEKSRKCLDTVMSTNFEIELKKTKD